MYHLTKGESQEVLVANGPGRKSSINASVFLQEDHRSLELSEWPAAIRENPAGLESVSAHNSLYGFCTANGFFQRVRSR